MKGRIIRLASALAVASAGVAMGVTFGAPAAHADPSLLAWTTQADANPFDLVVDNANGLDGAHPLSEIDVPEDSSNFETGPLGYALASILWPGAVLGNLGSIGGEAGLPSQLASALPNDPVKAESFYPAGPTSATYPPGAASAGLVEMSSYADSTQSWAKAGLADVSVPGLFDLQSVQGSTTATATSVAQSTASGTFHSLSLLGGLIQIGATSSTASAQSDGTTPSGTSKTDIGAITVDGQPVSVGSGGLAVGPAGANLSGASGLATSVVNELVSVLNLKMALLPETQTNQGTAETITSGGLSLSFSLPSNLSLSLDCNSLGSELAQLNILCQAPNELEGLNFNFTIGRVTASALATPPFSLGLGLPLSSLPNLTSPAGLTTGVTSSPFLDTEPVLTTEPALGTPPVLTTMPTAATASRPTGLLAVALSSPVGAGLLAILIAVAIAFGLGLRRFATGMALAKPDESCPLEERP
jgi:hypothetical protein